MNDILALGGNGIVLKNRVVGIGEAKGKPIGRLIELKESEGKVLDFRKGRAAKTIVYLEDGLIALSTITIETLQKRLVGKKEVE